MDKNLFPCLSKSCRRGVKRGKVDNPNRVWSIDMCMEVKMRPKQTKLWSIHDPSFCLRSGNVDHSKSGFYMNTNGFTPGVKDACRELWRRIGELNGQIVWCYTCDCTLAPTAPGR